MDLQELFHPGTTGDGPLQLDHLDDTSARAENEAGPAREVVLSGGSVVSADGRLVVHQVLVRDVTQQRQLEERLRSTQRMESLGRLAGGIAHDFNNLLTVIVSNAEILHESHAQESRDILDAAERGQRLTRRLQTFARGELVRPRVIDAVGLVSENTRMLRRVIGEEITLEVCSSPQPIPVNVDAGQISQIISNLVLNARDALDGVGRIVVETRATRLDRDEIRVSPGRGQGRYALISVRDDGPGIPAEIRDRIFEPFFTTKGGEGGTGLGLATVYGVVQVAGGGLDVRDAPGGGTIFDIYLPVSNEVAELAIPPRPRRTTRSAVRARILLVDDEPSIVNVLQRYLVHHGHEVTTARDGEQALDALRAMSRPPDVLVSDVVMPRLRGPELSRRARLMHPKLHVILMTGYADTSTGLDADTEVLLKPFEPSALHELVIQALARTRSARQEHSA